MIVVRTAVVYTFGSHRLSVERFPIFGVIPDLKTMEKSCDDFR